MGKLLLIVLAAIVAFMLLGFVISALHFIFWVAVVALIVVVGLRLTGGARRLCRRAGVGGGREHVRGGQVPDEAGVSGRPGAGRLRQPECGGRAG